MEKDLELTKKMTLARMDNACISTIDKPVVGTQALATCFGILIYEQEKKIAVVAHISSDVELGLAEALKLLDYKKPHVYQYKIFPGYYSQKEDPYKIKIYLEEIFKVMNTKKVKYIPFIKQTDKALSLDEETKSYEFAFNAQTGEFVTDQVLFGEDYFDLVGGIKR